MGKDSNGKVLRVVLTVEVDGERVARGYDLLGSFVHASLDDWRALIAATGRGTGAVRKGLQRLDDYQTVDELSPEAELQLIDTLGDLVFLARRRDGERGSYETLAGGLPFFQIIGEVWATAQAQAANDADDTDPTQAPTASSPTARGASKDGGPRAILTD